MNNEIYHHGIKGQKWGKRNGPPYPLTSSMMTSAQRKKNKVSKWAVVRKKETDSSNSEPRRYETHDNAHKTHERKSVSENLKQIKKTLTSKKYKPYNKEQVAYDEIENKEIEYNNQKKKAIATATKVVAASAALTVGYLAIRHNANIPNLKAIGQKILNSNAATSIKSLGDFFAPTAKSIYRAPKYLGGSGVAKDTGKIAIKAIKNGGNKVTELSKKYGDMLVNKSTNIDLNDLSKAQKITLTYGGVSLGWFAGYKYLKTKDQGE